MSVMAIGKWNEQIKEFFGKYKYVILILIIGMLFMLQPSKEEKEVPQVETVAIQAQEELCRQLEEILMNMYGAGDVMVMLSESQGESTIYQTDTTSSVGDKGTDTKTQTILITDSQRNEAGLVYQKNPPVYQGAIIIAQGADQPSVKLAIVDAVSKITGLGANKISVLKMK